MFRDFDDDHIEAPKPMPLAQATEPTRERSGYGQCLMCNCGAFYNDGTGDCRCGHDFTSHY